MDYSMSATEPSYPAPGAPEMQSVGAANRYRIRRPGARPLVFTGTELAMSMSFSPELPYWYELNIYRTDGQKFVLAIRLFFQAENEDDRVKAWLFDSLPEVFDAIEEYDAAHDVMVEFPDTSTMSPAEMAAKALEFNAKVASSRAHFSGIVGELLAEMETIAAPM